MTDEESCEHKFVRDEHGETCELCGMQVIDARDIAMRQLKEASIDLDETVLIILYLLPRHKSMTDTKLMKEIFLVEREGPKMFTSLPPAGFKPDQFGPCSQMVYHSLGHLKEDGLIRRASGAVCGSNETALTGEGIAKAKSLLTKVDKEKVKEMAGFLSDLDSFDQRELLRYVYTRYPAYTFYSTIKDKVLKSGDAHSDRGEGPRKDRGVGRT